MCPAVLPNLVQDEVFETQQVGIIFFFDSSFWPATAMSHVLDAPILVFWVQKQGSGRTKNDLFCTVGAG